MLINGSTINRVAINARTFIPIFFSGTVAEFEQVVTVSASNTIIRFNQTVILASRFEGSIASIQQSVEQFYSNTIVNFKQKIQG